MKKLESLKNLRRRATDFLETASKDLDRIPKVDIRELVYELDVHQVELEMQNDELLHIQAELHESKEKYENLYQFAPVGYVTLDLGMVILEANQMVAKLLGDTMNNLIGSKIEKFITPDDQGTARVHYQEALEQLPGEGANRCELKIHNHSLGEIYVQFETIADEKQKRGIRTYKTVLTDITARKKLQDDLQNAHDDLEKKVKQRTLDLEMSNKDLEEFAQIAAHDLQEPLRKIIIFSDRMEKSCPESCPDKVEDGGLDSLKKIQQSALRMQKFIDDLFTLSKIKIKKDPFISCDLEQVIREVLDDLEIRIRRTKAAINLGGFPTIDGDPLQMHKLFLNLISNALKYRRKEEAPVISLSSSQDGNGNWIIRVADNGIGFDEKYLDRIFKPFERLHGKSAFEGTGIGLAICERIVERHRGTITAKSEPQKGATFIITLPEKQPE